MPSEIELKPFDVWVMSHPVYSGVVGSDQDVDRLVLAALRDSWSSSQEKAIRECAEVADTLLYPDETKVSARIRCAILSKLSTPSEAPAENEPNWELETSNGNHRFLLQGERRIDIRFPEGGSWRAPTEEDNALARRILEALNNPAPPSQDAGGELHLRICEEIEKDDAAIEGTISRGAFFLDWRLASLAAKKGHRAMVTTTAGDFIVLTDVQELQLRAALKPKDRGNDEGCGCNNIPDAQATNKVKPKDDEGWVSVETPPEDMRSVILYTQNSFGNMWAMGFCAHGEKDSTGRQIWIDGNTGKRMLWPELWHERPSPPSSVLGDKEESRG